MNFLTNIRVWSILLTLSLGLLVGCSSKPVFRSIEAADANSFAAKKRVVVMDIRTPAEFAEGHLPNAVNVDFLDSSFQKNIQALDRGKKYLVYCRTGKRSLKAVDQMKEMGFVNITHIKDGIIAWKGPIEH